MLIYNNYNKEVVCKIISSILTSVAVHTIKFVCNSFVCVLIVLKRRDLKSFSKCCTQCELAKRFF